MNNYADLGGCSRFIFLGKDYPELKCLSEINTLPLQYRLANLINDLILFFECFYNNMRPESTLDYVRFPPFAIY